MAGVRRLGCVLEVFLGCHTTVRGCAKRYDHFLYTENQPNKLAFGQFPGVLARESNLVLVSNQSYRVRLCLETHLVSDGV